MDRRSHPNSRSVFDRPYDPISRPRHTETLTQAGFRVVPVTHEHASAPEVLRLEPRVIIAELADGAREAMFDLVRRLRRTT